MARHLKRQQKTNERNQDQAMLMLTPVFVISVFRLFVLSSSLDWISGGHHRQHHGETYFRMRPLGQLVFSLVWVLAGTIFLVGLLFEKKKTILPFATVFAIDWSVILIQHLTKLERRSFLELVLSTGTAVLVVIPVYVGFTLAVLYRLFEQRSKERAQLDEEDMENGRKPVKFSLGEEFDDSWIS